MTYDTVAFRHFLRNHFSDDELTALCFDYFPAVFDDFTSGMLKGQKIQLLLSHCRLRERIPILMAALERERAEQYQEQFSSASRVEVPVTQPRPYTPQKPYQVFISHAHEDVEFAQRLANDLEAHGWRVWIAPTSIKPGEKWVDAINRGLSESGVFVLVMTPSAIESRWVQTETNGAIELEHQGKVRLIPLQLEPCDAPTLLRTYQHISFQNQYTAGLESLLTELEPQQAQGLMSGLEVTVTEEAILRAIYQDLSPEQRFTGDDEIANQLGLEVQEIHDYLELMQQGGYLNLTKTSGGWIVGLTAHGRIASRRLGLGERTDSSWSTKPVQAPGQTGNLFVWGRDGKDMVRVPAGEYLHGPDKNMVYLPDFWIDRTPVTNAEYAQFVTDTGHRTPNDWKGEIPPEELLAHPVIFVSWHDATSYAEWVGKRVPTEAEWEKAARGTDGREYPWGSQEPNSQLCNFSQNEGATTPVSQYSPQSDSFYGCVDMAGNVWEWTRTASDAKTYVLRGGSWFSDKESLRCAYRGRQPVEYLHSDVGFRLVASQSQMERVLTGDEGVQSRLRIIPEFHIKTGRGASIRIKVTNVSSSPIYIEGVTLLLTSGREITQSNLTNLEVGEPCEFWFPLFDYRFNPLDINGVVVPDTAGNRQTFPINDTEKQVFSEFQSSISEKHDEIPEELMRSEGEPDRDNSNSSGARDWPRGSVTQWSQRRAGFEPIPLEPVFNTRNLFQDLGELNPKPLLGRERIPFLLRTDENREYIRGVEHRPAHSTDRDVSQEITPGVENVVSAYVLVSADNAWRIKEGVRFEGKRIGYLEFHHSPGVITSVPLVLGENIRAWSHLKIDDVGVVNRLTDPNMEQVWRSPDDSFTLDMLRVDLGLGAEDFPISRYSSDVQMLRVVAECQGLRPSFPRNDIPSIQVYGLTYAVMIMPETGEPAIS